ncbi:MAG TPA: C25 family cysteine peptidase [Candidatus Thermoplasmatota archaeon]|nr:C25 family cysteine peptidase [Candidatus Thermoplasmatota archaeon]
MREKNMRKVIILFVGLFVTAASILPSIGGRSPETQTVNTSSSNDVSITVQQMGDVTRLQYTIDAFTMTPVEINDKQYVDLALDDEAISLVAGAPALPSIARSIIIPYEGTMTIRVIGTSYEEYQNILVAPSKGNLLRTVNPADIPYEFGDVYTQNTWYPSTITELQDPYYLRDFRGQVVTIYPFQYNPEQATLRFYNDITVEITPSQQITTHNNEQFQLTTVDNDFLSLYQHHFINYNSAKYNPVSEQGNMLVITYDSFYSTMVPFVEWKNLKGIPTEMVNVSSIGNANAIKTYITDYYNTKGLTFVLLVGDVAQVPTLYPGYGASDPSYSYIVGSDHYADLFVGRFSAENVAQAQTQANRTISYERDPQIDAPWYEKGVGIASSQGPGDDNEMDYQHIRNIRTLLLNFTYAGVDELYDGSQGGGDAGGDPSTTMVATALNEGRSIINYCGHGSMTSWGSSGFSNSNVNALTNDNMLPFITSVACNNGEFDSGTCFGEAWLRATHNGQPIGAIGAYMSSISQSWDPPMEAQDEFNNILIGKYPENQKTTFGALCFTGSMSMIDEYGSSGEGEADAWTVFGDPSVQVRTDIPFTMEVIHDEFIPNGAETFEVDVVGLPNALCAISADGALLGNGYSDQTGHAIIQFFSPIGVTGEVQLVVTGLNAIPYMTTIMVGEPNLPPAKPDKPTGRATGQPGNTYMYSSSTTDPEGDGVYYLWDWGDGNFSEWVGPYASGNSVSTQKSWTEQGNYSVRVKAKDSQGHESVWSDPLDVTMPYNLPYFVKLLDLLETLFPRLFQFFENFAHI